MVGGQDVGVKFVANDTMLAWHRVFGAKFSVQMNVLTLSSKEL
jgi:hypothetical protein